MTYDDLEEQLEYLRPRLHRFCARMTGSVFDGEDVLQEALMRAFRASANETDIVDLERWIFKIAHNTAIDFLRKSARDFPRTDYDPDLLAQSTEPNDYIDSVSSSMATLMRLPANQRAVVLLKDVMGYGLQEMTGILDLSLPAIKTALHRGRARLRELAGRDFPATWAPRLSETERALLERYVDRFNAYDFDAIRDTLAEEVRLDLVGVERRQGKRNVAHYFENYSKRRYWRLHVGIAEGRYVVLVHGTAPDSPPMYFIVLEWKGTELHSIRDFGHARYAFENCEIVESFQRAGSSFGHEGYNDTIQDRAGSH